MLRRIVYRSASSLCAAPLAAALLMGCGDTVTVDDLPPRVTALGPALASDDVAAALYFATWDLEGDPADVLIELRVDGVCIDTVANAIATNDSSAEAMCPPLLMRGLVGEAAVHTQQVALFDAPATIEASTLVEASIYPRGERCRGLGARLPDGAAQPLCETP